MGRSRLVKKSLTEGRLVVASFLCILCQCRSRVYSAHFYSLGRRQVIVGSPVTTEATHNETTLRNTALLVACSLGIGVGHPNHAVHADGHDEDPQDHQPVGQKG